MTTDDTSVTGITGSIAARSFAEATTVLHRHAAAADALDRHRRPAIDLVASSIGGTASGGSHGTVAASTGAASGPLLEASAAIADGTTTAVALATAALAAIDARNEELVGMVAVDRRQVLTDAAALDEELAAGAVPRSPLHGIPVSIKDVIDVAGLPTRCGSDAYEVVPASDADVVARLRAAGAVIVGKASTHEYALGVTSPQSHNPHDPSRLPGGSSGGSAISVATGMALASIGTDTRASIRVPAALSGVVGLKPTYGTLSTRGVVSLAWTMDHVAPMAATVGDVALVLDVLTGAKTGPLLAAAGGLIDGLRIGVPAAGFVDAEPGVTAAVHDALDRLASSGAKIDDAPRPDAADLALANAAGLIVSRCEAATIHRSLGLDRSRYWEEVADQLGAAAEIPAVDYLEAQRARAELRAGLETMFTSFDLLAMPTSPVVAPPRDDFADYLMLLARNAIPWSFIGLPAISVPCGTSAGLPVGLQLVAPPGREDLLVAVATSVEETVAWHG